MSPIAEGSSSSAIGSKPAGALFARAGGLFAREELTDARAFSRTELTKSAGIAFRLLHAESVVSAVFERRQR
jgi:hypothetical protein